MAEAGWSQWGVGGLGSFSALFVAPKSLKDFISATDLRARSCRPVLTHTSRNESIQTLFMTHVPAKQTHIHTAKRMQGPHTEHGHVLLAAEVPVTPVGSVAVQRGILLVVVSRLSAEGVNHSNVAPGRK